MKAILLAFMLSAHIPLCVGRHFKALHAYDFAHKPRLSMRDHELSDKGCEDLPKWKDKCAEWAKDDAYCKSKFMQHYCRGTCKVCGKIEPPPPIEQKPPAPTAPFCQDYDKNCGTLKKVGLCEIPNQKEYMAIYCGVSCEMCQAPTPGECYDKKENGYCEDLKKAGHCSSSDPKKIYEAKTNCLVKCEFCGKGSWDTK